ncbi:MAG: cupin domain-containing protein [Sulfuricellaceae bacterium]
MSTPIINIADVVLESRPQAFAPTGAAADRFDARIGAIGARIGAKKLGYNITAVPPGKSAFPFHNHWVNEEMVFVLQGAGTIRIGADKHPIRSGDVVALPPGSKEAAHEIINTGEEELRYLAVSTKLSPEVGEYPDSGKFGVFAEAPTAPDGNPHFFRFIGRDSQSLNYWEGE